MSKYDFSGSQIGAAGDGAIATNINFYNNKIEKELDLVALEEEIIILKEKLNSKKNKSSEEYRVLANMADVEEDIKKKDKEGIIEKIKGCATTTFYNMSVGIGSGILANIISNFLKI